MISLKIGGSIMLNGKALNHQFILIRFVCGVSIVRTKGSMLETRK